MRTTTFDLSPFHRSVIGFERLARALESAPGGETGYPPYNIERLEEDRYRVTMAVAGFTVEDIDITVHDGVLHIAGKLTGDDGDEDRYLHRGIATRAFERRFQLADYIEVTGADLQNGLLSVDLERRVPEAKKPRRIAITGANAGQPVLENEAKAA